MFWYLKWFFKDPKGSWKVLWHMSPGMTQGLMIMINGIISSIIISTILKNSSALYAQGIASMISEVVGISTLAFHRASNVYYGQLTRQKKPNVEAMQETTTFKIVTAYCIVTLAAILVLSIGAGTLVGAASKNNAKAMSYGGPYLNYILIIWTMTPVIYAINYTLNASGKAHISMSISFVGIVFNLLFAWLLVDPSITPHLGIRGAAIGEALSKFIQLIIIIFYLIKFKPLWTPKLRFWKIRKWMWINGLKTGLFIWPSEVLYTIFILLLSTIIANTAATSTQASDIGAAVIPILGSFLGLFYYTLATGLRSVLPRYVASYMGLDDVKKTKLNAEKVLGMVTWVNILFSLIILSSAWWYPLAYSGSLTSDLSKNVAKYMLIGCAFSYFFYKTSNAVIYTMRKGGYQLILSMVDQLPYYAVYLPLTFLLLHYKAVNIEYVFLIVPFSTIFQYVISIVLYYQLPWYNKNLVKKVTLSKEEAKNVTEKNIFPFEQKVTPAKEEAKNVKVKESFPFI